MRSYPTLSPRITECPINHERPSGYVIDNFAKAIWHLSSVLKKLPTSHAKLKPHVMGIFVLLLGTVRLLVDCPHYDSALIVAFLWLVPFDVNHSAYYVIRNLLTSSCDKALLHALSVQPYVSVFAGSLKLYPGADVWFFQRALPHSRFIFLLSKLVLWKAHLAIGQCIRR